ncbi:hypothetical protein KUTeg_017405 [Tegillarca granosa]|uniref:NADAR domain-containing protein n=1 Tax=Tegillarca granosa TaxID=220873 RepID=A0ABQ9EIN6_TEGGR|nr:hypothetical protein KUTeg_017405 [Tegillarca granosa]
MAIFFKGVSSPLSNFYPCQIFYLGFIFQSVEHAYQFAKARFHGLHHLAHKIRNAPTAGILKSLTKNITISENWHKNKLNILWELVNIKFNNCSAFKEFLLSTNNQNLNHNVSDAYWRTGDEGGQKIGGQNIFGNMLMQLRNCHLPPPQSKLPIKQTTLGLYGSSYVKHLETFYAQQNYPNYETRFFGQGGMTVHSFNKTLLTRLIEFKPMVAIILLGGNDINSKSKPLDITHGLLGIQETLKTAGIQHVFIFEIPTRGKYRDPQLDQASFDNIRRTVLVHFNAEGSKHLLLKIIRSANKIVAS